MNRFLKVTLATSLMAAFTLQLSGAEKPGFRSLFNGKDLTGWDGNRALWSVKDGVIHGETTAADPLKFNTFLVYTNGNVSNFELHFKYKIVGNNPGKQANSGV